MICPTCEEYQGVEVEMEKEEVTEDFHDPSQPDGHGQHSETVWLCGNCAHQEPYINEPDYED